MRVRPHGRNAWIGKLRCAGLKEDWGEGRKCYRGEARRRGRTSEKPWQDGNNTKEIAEIARILEAAIVGTGPVYTFGEIFRRCAREKSNFEKPGSLCHIKMSMPGSFDGRSSTGGDSQPQGLAGIGLLMQQVVPPALPSPALSVPPFARGVLLRLERVFARKMAARLAPPPLCYARAASHILVLGVHG